MASAPELHRNTRASGPGQSWANFSANGTRERNAESAERMLIEWKKAAFMQDKVGQRFEGRVVGITERGVFVLLLEHHVEGFVRVQALARDWYDRDERGVRLVGRDTGRILRLGDRLSVVVLEVDVLSRRIGLAEIA